MAEIQTYPLVTTTGLRGRVYRTSRFLDRSRTNRVVLDDGSEFQVPSASVRPQDDGSFLLHMDAANSAAAPAATEEPAAAADAVQETAPSSGRDIVVDEPLFTEDVHVEHVTVNRILDEPATVRTEGDVTIVPVMEEVVTIQKRLLLREEVRITRRRTEIREPRRVVMGRDRDRIIGADGRDVET